MEDEFGAGYAHVVADDLVLAGMGDRTGSQALADGEDPKAVWLAVCQTQSIPEERRLGRDVPPKR